ncbi:phosphate acyltransferase [Marinobacterium nitratireducens]|uniref:Phosphate acyltransferase n=1 Tax=Marinobacterium nitratireducens TaxID=518897 RepID=A0A917ZMG7_9GAMM|nr:phosphate acyltransferase PlsX [Marinobacterium nitratireducens]GGO87082.1 phosphate acyltransferase [Marinobacterium nitratireducens]
MSRFFTIAVDAMGGDFGPRVTVPATVEALKRYPGLTILLVGQPDAISPYLKKLPDSLSGRLEIVPADDVIGMDEKPSLALRKGRNSSMYRSMQQVSDGRAHACVSAGNTGALMAMGRRVLKTLPGVDRPAIVTAVPTTHGHCYMLDLGANVDSGASHLLQFAVMGSIMTRAVEHIEAPRVGLLNIGEEEIKGNEQVKLASRLIEDYGRLNYIGYIEGDDVFAGRADVVVCDGFVGNIALKSAEGVSRLISRKVRSSFSRNPYRRLLAWLARPVLRELQAQLDPSRRNGASLLGLQGIVVKSHGGANRKCFGFAIDQAVAEVETDVPSRISEQLAASLV